MRVLWFTNTPCNYKLEGGYNGGGWMTALQNSILSSGENICFGICFCMDGQPSKVESNNTIYYPVPSHRKSVKDKVFDLLKYDDVTRDEILWPYYINNFKRVINDYHPDIIEVFGSELYIGLASMAAKELKVPCCLHIQGLLSLYIYSLLPSGISTNSFIWKDGLKGAFANFQFLVYWKRSCYREKKILQSTNHFIGRTHWDKNAVSFLNPNAKYHYGGEILRSCFYEGRQRTFPKVPVIVTTISGASYKGFDLVLKIAEILKNEFGLNFIWKVYGNVDPLFFEKITNVKHDEVNVQLCGVASAEELRDSMLNATVYLQPSYVENSPNSVAEAQILGLPVVATNVGGTSSMVSDGESGFLFPCTDPYMGVYNILKLINDQSLNIAIGNAGKAIAKDRHNCNIIVNQLIQTYKEVINDK